MVVPSSLYEALTTPVHGESKPQRVLAFKNALPQRQRKLKDALSNALNGLAEDPPLALTPPQGANTWGKSNSTYSSSHTPPESPAPRYHPPPEGLPDAAKAPRPKKPRTHECQNPMRPRLPQKRERQTQMTNQRSELAGTHSPLEPWLPLLPLTPKTTTGASLSFLLRLPEPGIQP